jgi:chromosome segregation protein
LGRVVIVEDMDSAIGISKRYSNRFKIVTVDGQVINPGGSMTGGSQSKGAGILSRGNMIEELNNKAKKLEKQAEEIKGEYKTALEEANFAGCAS